MSSRRTEAITPSAEPVDIGLASPSIFESGKAHVIRFSTLAICAALACRPGDLLEFKLDPVATGQSRAARTGNWR